MQTRNENIEKGNIEEVSQSDDEQSGGTDPFCGGLSDEVKDAKSVEIVEGKPMGDALTLVRMVTEEVPQIQSPPREKEPEKSNIELSLNENPLVSRKN